MTRAWDKEKIWVPDRNWTHDLPNTGRALYPLSHENSWRARPFNWVLMWHASCKLLVSARSMSLWIVINESDGEFFISFEKEWKGKTLLLSYQQRKMTRKTYIYFQHTCVKIIQKNKILKTNLVMKSYPSLSSTPSCFSDVKSACFSLFPLTHSVIRKSLRWIYTSYAMVSSGRLWNIPRVTWFFSIHTSL